MSHGGLTPPALVLPCECLPAKSDFCDARTHLDKSGGRQPAVLPKNVSATASDFRTATTFARCKRPHNHGGLTPPAPGCTTFVRCIKRHWQCTYARRPRAAGVSPPWLGTRVCSGETLDIYVAIQNRYPTRNTRLQRRDFEQTEDWLARVSVVGFQNGGVPIYRPIATSGLDSKSVVQSLVC
jgi:hypothetical protein